MKIAISANGKELESTVHEQFGRCPYFLIVETDDLSFQAIENTNADMSTGAGIQSAMRVASEGAKAVITGRCGPNATRVFAQTNLQLDRGHQGVIKDVVEAFKRGDLKPSARENANQPSDAIPPNVRRPQKSSNSGRGMAGSGRGMGGGGRGMGGGGRGMGGGCGLGRRWDGSIRFGSTDGQQSPANFSRPDELAKLQQHADELKQQMETIHSRIKELS